MPNDLDFPKRLLAVALSAAFPAHSFAQTAARVDFTSGNVTASTPGGGSRPLSRGAEVRVGETVSTQNGRAQMRFTDGAFVSLQPQTDFKIDNYVFEGRGTPNESAVMSLLKGGMRTITGLVGRTNREGYKVQTATATVGIRGTEYSISYDEGGSVTMFVAGGAIAVTNQTGTTVVPGGRSVNVGGQNSAPQTVNEKPFLSPGGSTPTAIATQTNVVQDAQTPAPAILTGVVPNAGIAEVMNERYSYPSSWTPQPPNYTTSATLNGAGGLTSWSAINSNGPSTETYSSGSAAVQSAGNDGVIAWGGWSGGSAAYTRTVGSSTYSEDIDLANSSPWFYVVGAPVPVMPTSGSAVYNMIGALAANPFAGSPSPSVIGSQLQVDFGNYGGSHTTTLRIDGALDEFRGPLVLYGSGNSFYANAQSRAVDSSTRYFYGAGFFAGNNASRAGMAFSVEGYDGYSESYGNLVNGVIAYAQAGASGAPMYSSTTLNTGAATTLFNRPELAATYNGSTTPNFPPGSSLANQNVQIGPSGGVYGFEGYGYTSRYDLANGTSSVQGAGNDGIIAWGRWVGGRDSNGKDLSATAFGPFHYIVGVPATSLPTSGTYEFSQIGHTASCAVICNTASVDSKLTVDYGSLNGSLDVSVKLDNAATYSALNVGGGFYVSNSRFSASGSLSPTVSAPNLNFQGRGFLAGNQSSNATARAGMAYSVSGTVNSLTGSVNGVIAYGNRVPTANPPQ